MITLGNRQNLTEAERRESLFRALHTQPFFNRLNFPVDTVGARKVDYASKADVNKDYYVTEIVGNFNEVESASGFADSFDASFYASLNNGSLYRYQQTFRLPVGFICSEARAGTVIYSNQQYDDRQYEFAPYRVKAGDHIIGTAKSRGGEKAIDIDTVIKGYYIFANNYLTDNCTRGINESLEREIRFETWQKHVDHTAGQKSYTFNNDRTARLVLGFGIVDKSTAGASVDQATVEVVDSFRNIRWTNQPIPIQFLAPRMGQNAAGTRDLIRYYLPMEYLFEPFASLQFNIKIETNGESNGFELVMLTRTV